jgi:hypothetical protein
LAKTVRRDDGDGKKKGTRHLGTQHQRNEEGARHRSQKRKQAGVQETETELTAKINGSKTTVNKSVPRVGGQLGTTCPATKVAAEGGAIVELGELYKDENSKDGGSGAKATEEPKAA